MSNNGLKSLFLTPASWLYSFAIHARHKLFDWGILKREKFSTPVVCIGNITVGGTGKTPMSELVIAFLSQHYTIALLSRGYGRRTKGYLEVEPTSHYHQVGDEPLQIKRKYPNVVVAVCEKRADGIRQIEAAHKDVDLIIMDDGFQHRYVEPKINIIMVDATRPVQEDKMLPAGTLRDTMDSLYRAHYFVVTKCPDTMTPLDRRLFIKSLRSMAYQKIYFTKFHSYEPQPLFPSPTTEPFDATKHQVVALSGIGNPIPFIKKLRDSYKLVDQITLEDHHAYKKGDLKTIENKLNRYSNSIIVTTEKDAVKLTCSNSIPQELRERIYFIPIRIEFTLNNESDFLKNLYNDIKN